MIDWVQTSVTEQKDSKYHVMNIGKLNNMGLQRRCYYLMRELDQTAFITRIKLGYAYIYQDHKTETNILEITLCIGVSQAQGCIRTGSSDLGTSRQLPGAVRWQQRMIGYHPIPSVDCKLMWDEKKYNIFVKADNITCHRYYDLTAVKQPVLWIMAGASVNLGR